jgi:hypothetical protein
LIWHGFSRFAIAPIVYARRSACVSERTANLAGGGAMRTFSFAVVFSLTVTATASAQTADWRFHWQQGQVLNYRVEQTTEVEEVVGGNKVETKSNVNLIKRWEVVNVDPQGGATVKMSIAAMRNEQTRPNGEMLVFDSKTPDKSTPALREQLSKFIGQTLAVLRVDAQGRVIEVKQGVASRYDVEPPFVLTLPAGPVNVGQSWERTYTIALDPPLGTGQKHAARQKYVCSKIDGPVATIAISTGLGKMPENKAEQLPLVQKLPAGEAIFDLQRGRLQSVKLAINSEIQNHQGEGSSYRFQSIYSEQCGD